MRDRIAYTFVLDSNCMAILTEISQKIVTGQLQIPDSEKQTPAITAPETISLPKLLDVAPEPNEPACPFDSDGVPFFVYDRIFEAARVSANDCGHDPVKLKAALKRALKLKPTYEQSKRGFAQSAMIGKRNVNAAPLPAAAIEAMDLRKDYEVRHATYRSALHLWRVRTKHAREYNERAQREYDKRVLRMQRVQGRKKAAPDDNLSSLDVALRYVIKLAAQGIKTKAANKPVADGRRRIK